MGGSSAPGKLELSAVEEGMTGSFVVPGWQSFEVIDAFFIDPVLWILTYHPSVGILPMRLSSAGDRISGEVLRVGLRVEGAKTGL